MAKLGRPALLEPTIEWKLRIPISLAAKADLLSLDPVRGVPAYGSRSALIIKLLRAHFEGMTHLDKLVENGQDGDSINGDINSPINLPENSNV